MEKFSYNPKDIEQKWQKIWSDSSCFKSIVEKKPKKYVLEMLPYPSGRIHMGHLRNYTIGDVIARIERSKGFNVLHPLGWDAFGLPAENAAIQNKVAPEKWTLENISSMKKQLLPMGFSYDWDREISTCDSDYYKHEQKFFIEFYNHGLAYQKESFVNWDPIDHTVLANEQVIDGRGWRSGALVERKKLTQWFLKITEFAEDLLSNIKTLEGWPEKVRVMQENWINKSSGAVVNFRCSNGEHIEIFTTRPETIFGASFIAISADHQLLKGLHASLKLSEFLEKCNKSATSEEALEKNDKFGFDTGLTAIHPFDSSIVLPIFIANFVLSEYGSGAIFGCPAHDKRDHEFAHKYKLPIKQVVVSDSGLNPNINDEPFIGDGIMVGSQFLDGLRVNDAKKIILERLEKEKIGFSKTTYRLRDWGISRQRYWGCPIPIIYCDSCGIVTVPEKDLPVTLPKDINFDKPGNPLSHHPTWKNVKCPECDQDARRETDTFDTFFESSWYFLRYCSPKSVLPFDKEEVAYWGSVDQYIGGIEHAVMHLLYARFFTMALKKLGYLDFSEPFTNLMTQGMINHETYKNVKGQWLYPEEVIKTSISAVEKSTGLPAIIGRPEKMSKSKKNVVEPDQIIEKYGADTVRLFVLSDSPPDKDLDWSDTGVEGCHKYLQRVMNMASELLAHSSDQEHSDDLQTLSIIHKTIQLVNQDYEKFHFNKAIARLRELTNILNNSTLSRKMRIKGLEVLIRLLNPIAPHITEEIWSALGHREYLAHYAWPQPDFTLIIDDITTIAVQTNGKLRATFEIHKNTAQKEIETTALNITAVKNFLTDKKIKKIIYIENKIINIVYD